jgi:hypothetical protein
MTNLGPISDRPRPTRVTHRVILGFGEFGWQSLDAEAGRERVTLDELLGRAVSYFAAAVRTTRAAALAPRAAALAPKFKPGEWGIPREIRLELTRDDWVRLDSEAEHQGIPLERLLEHAPLLYLADLDSGRVAKRLLGRAE